MCTSDGQNPVLLGRYAEFRNMSVAEISNILNHTIQYVSGCECMSEDSTQILETIRKRELDIEIMQLQLKHNLTKKRAESKLLIMYYKACNAMSRAKLMMYGINGYDIKAPQPPNSVNQPNDPQQKRF